jgi:hypothetical protein
MGHTWHVGLLLLGTLCLRGARAHCGSLSGLLDDPSIAKLELAPIGSALANTVALTYPVASASSSVTYAYNPALDTYERQTGVAGPIFGERAETIGSGQLNVGASYSYVRFATINGDDLDDLQNRRLVGGRAIVFPVRPAGAILRDGRFTNFLPVRVVADFDVEAHILTASVTYGVTPDLDVNLYVPLLRTSLDLTARTQVPDPRFPDFALPRGDPRARRDKRSLSGSAEGVGDVLLRAKYLLHRGRPFDVAAGFGLSLPTGEEDDLQGSGTTRLQPTLILSRVFAQRIEPLVNVGIDVNADDAGRSIVRWAVGATALIAEPVTAALVFLGRHELAPQTEQIRRPFFFQIERNDVIDAAVGFRYRFAENGVISANALLPLNEDGLRADVIPTIEVEYVFSVP